MNKFDPVKALKEEISGLNEVLKVLNIREKQAEEQLGLAEIELNAIRKLTGFAKIEIERKHKVLQELENDTQT